MKFKILLRLLRVKQWYKNAVIFIPLIFSSNLFNFDLALLTSLGFLALCLISSANYVINDLVDYPFDKKNPLKKHKPLVSGSVSIAASGVVAMFLVVSSFILAFSLGDYFFLFPLALFVSTSLYTFKLKHLPIFDLFVIAFNFFIRTVAGGFLINVQITNWLILLIFLLALLLALSKRYGSLLALGKSAARHRPVFKFYTKNFLSNLINIIAGSLIIGYCFYTFLSAQTSLLMLSIPIFLFIMFRYLYLVYSGSDVSINAEQLLNDKQFVIALVVWLVSVMLVLY